MAGASGISNGSRGWYCAPDLWTVAKSLGGFPSSTDRSDPLLTLRRNRFIILFIRPEHQPIPNGLFILDRAHVFYFRHFLPARGSPDSRCDRPDFTLLSRSSLAANSGVETGIDPGNFLSPGGSADLRTRARCVVASKGQEEARQLSLPRLPADRVGSPSRPPSRANHAAFFSAYGFVP